jgi:hypothetical protein
MAKREPRVRIPLGFEETLKDLLKVKPPSKGARKLATKKRAAPKRQA